MKTRDQNEVYINQLYGTDGPVADELILRLVHELGLWAFTDEAVARLAQLHREYEEQEVAAVMRRHR